MLDFNEDEFRQRIASAVALRPQVEDLADSLIEQGIDNVLLIGSGGTYAQMLPYEHLAQRRSTLPVRAAISKELIESGDSRLGKSTLAVFASVTGTTRDVIEAIEYVKDKGAITVAFTGHPESPIGQSVEHVLSSKPKTWPFDMQLLLLVGRLLHTRGEFPDYAKVADDLAGLPEALVKVAEAAEEGAQSFAESHKDSAYYFLIGGGPLWGFTYLYSMCILEEMQWLHTTRVNSAELFHGSLELIEEDTSVMVFKGEDETRPLTDRAEAFTKRVSGDVTVFDTKDYELAGFSDETRALMGPIVLDTVMDRVAKHLARVRDHSLDLRRYYRVMEY
ncbi:SIS domain-containing protein [Brevibacterium sp. FME17]|uniref:SIS domain-containing protein n=1 Tax=Brevibacterium sp. FME17 TaxID=2742606 RepID=UPI0018668FB7|nr:SIS domain-containing protein [Brevibacterium sp. FME17]